MYETHVNISKDPNSVPVGSKIFVIIFHKNIFVPKILQKLTLIRFDLSIIWNEKFTVKNVVMKKTETAVCRTSSPFLCDSVLHKH